MGSSGAVTAYKSIKVGGFENFYGLTVFYEKPRIIAEVWYVTIRILNNKRVS